MTREPWSPLHPEPITRAQLLMAVAGGMAAAFVAWLVLGLAIALLS